MSYIRGKNYIYLDINGKFFLDGTYVPEDIVDDFVVMRYAELVEEKKVAKIEKRAMKRWKGNFGCDPLLRKYKRETTEDWLKRQEKQSKTKGLQKRK